MPSGCRVAAPGENDLLGLARPGPLWPTARRGPHSTPSAIFDFPLAIRADDDDDAGQELGRRAGGEGLEADQLEALQEQGRPQPREVINNTGNRVYGRARLRPASFWETQVGPIQRCHATTLRITAGRASRRRGVQPRLPLRGCRATAFHVPCDEARQQAA